MVETKPETNEHTASLPRQGEGSGPAMMIPGAFERRTTIAVASELPVTGTAATPKASGGAVPTGERLVYELEGGGAPSQRSRGRPTMLQKFWHSLRSRPQDPKARKATTLKESVKHPTGET